MSDPATPSSTTAATPAATPGPAGNPDPASVLAKLQEKLGQDEAQVDSLTTELKMLRSDIQGLQQGLSKIDSAVADYGKAGYPAAATALGDTAATQSACLKAALGGKLARADDVIQGLRTDIDHAGQAKDKAAADVDNASAAVAQAETSLQQAQSGWDNLTGLTGALRAQFSSLSTLQNQAKQAMDAGDHFGAYAIVTEIERMLGEAKPGLRTQDEYRAALIDAWGKLSTAQANLRDAQVALGTANAALKQANDKLGQLTADRVAELRRRWALPPAAPAPEAPATTPAAAVSGTLGAATPTAPAADE